MTLNIKRGMLMKELINDWFSFRNVTNPFEIIEKTVFLDRARSLPSGVQQC